MTDYLDLALTYGGFTSLDKVYLKHQLEGLNHDQKLAFITPPPSVINAYFAELYQKQSPQVATDYYFDLSKSLNLLTSTPSFAEIKPFVRLNLSGKSYGFAYVNDQEEALVFSEKEEAPDEGLFFELAQIFPQYKIFAADQTIRMQPLPISETVLEQIDREEALLSNVQLLEGGWLKISGFNQEEVCQLAQAYQGQIYYAFEQRQAIIYIKNV
ncbi:cystathionine beta-lyase [Streptococcus ferus]|uniref:cystathionine beta-lyase n=1 Tax=Streptococcus ferus TaxID=1345 RepID=UPI0035A0FBA0